MFATVLAANAFGLRVSSGFQLGLSAVLITVMAIAIAVALPSKGGDNWTPFAPHGWWAVGTAANILVWLFVGWEAVAQLAGDFRRPEVDLPRAMALAFGIVTVLYIGLAVATVGVTGDSDSKVPLADLISVGFGRVGRDATAVLAVALTMGTMNVYMGGFSKLAASLANEGALPAWLGGDCLPQRPAAAARRDRGGRASRCSLALARRGQQHRRPDPRDLGLLHRRLRAGGLLGDAHPRRAPARARVGDARAGARARASSRRGTSRCPPSRRRFRSYCIGTIVEAAGLGPPFAMLKRIDIPVADPGTPDTRSPVRLLVWVGKHQKRTLALGIFFGIWWMLAQALMPFAIGRAIQLGIVEGSTPRPRDLDADPARARR